MSKARFEEFASRVLNAGKVVCEPVGPGKGYWAGAPGIFQDGASGATYLAYRIRRPRGVLPDRGAELRLARSSDGVRFETVRTLLKDDFASSSIERCALRLGADGSWRLFLSCVDPADGRWCVAALDAPSIEHLEPAQVRSVFKASDLGLEGVKDPWILKEGATFYMFLSAAMATASTTAQSHATQDIYNTGQCISATALATSADLDRWEWQGIIFAPEGGAASWDGYCRRISSVVPCAGKFLAFYDGSRSHGENYEEKTGLAISDDLKNWKTLTSEGPALTSPHASRSLRYVDAQKSGARIRLYYELARRDGAHELRMSEVGAMMLEDLLSGDG